MNLNNHFHILNPAEKYKKKINKLFHDVNRENYGWVERKTHPTHLETMVEWAIDNNKSRIAIWGGDGTFSRTIQKLFEMDYLKETNISFIPVGTCNDFNKIFNYKNWKAAANEILKDRDEKNIKPIDVGILKVNGKIRIFINNAGFGREPRNIKVKRGNPIQDILNFKEKRLQVECESEHIHHYETFRTFFGIFFNAPFFNCGLNFSKEVEPDDGLLDGFFVPPQSRIGLLIKFIKARFGKSLKDSRTIHLKGNRINIESDQEVFPQVDGETVIDHGVKKLEFSVLKGMLKLEMPA